MLLLRKLLNKILNSEMESLDVDPLFTNIPLEETIDICTNTLFENTEKVEGLSNVEFKELLSLATKESYFIFNGKLYKQVDGVAMASPLGPTLANTFLVHFEKNWLQNCPCDFKSRCYWWYADDIYLCFIYLTKTFRSLPEFSKWSAC